AAVAPARAAKTAQTAATSQQVVSRTAADSSLTTRVKPQPRPDAAPELAGRAHAVAIAADTPIVRDKRLSLGDMIDKIGADAAVAAVNALQGIGKSPRGQRVDTARVGLLIKVLETD